MHNNHKIIEVSDVKSLQEENITLETSAKNFDTLLKKINSIKDKIQEEILKINNLFEKTNEELTKSFKRKHELLNKEENDIREKLQNEVTKTKEKLEILFSESDNKIKLTNRIQQGLKKLEKEESKNIYKTLSYISQMNKNEKEINKLSLQLMKSMNFYYNEEKNNIEYEEYFFNDFEIGNISSNGFLIYFNIENEDIINDDSKNAEVIIENRVENIDINFKQIYKGKYHKNPLVIGLSPNTKYEFRFCFLNEDMKIWSKPQKIKTSDIDSEILRNCDLKNDYIKKIFEWTKSKTKKFELIYRGTRDGSSSEKFHELCDNQGPTIVLYKNEKDNIFGGYASISWQNKGEKKSAPDSFIFTLTNIYNIEPTKFPSNNNKCEVFHNSNWGPRFGNGRDIGTEGDFLQKESASYFPDTYKDVLGKGRSIFTSDFNNNKGNFKIKEIEVFKCE